MLTDEDKRALLKVHGETIHQWVLRINGYFPDMNSCERLNTLYNIAEEAFKAGVKERITNNDNARAKIKTATMIKKKVTAESSIVDKMELPVIYTGLRQHSLNVLSRAGITTIGELMQYSRKELLKLPRAGMAVVFDIEEMLKTYGLGLRDNKDRREE